MNLLAIDPGDKQSAFVVFDGRKILDKGKVPNGDLLNWALPPVDHLAIEMIASYGMPVGQTVFETCVWIGRFIQQYKELHHLKHTLVYRHEVKVCLCHSVKAKDGNIRQALIDMFPATGAGAIPQLGTKKTPGPLYGISADMWAALGVAITWFKTKRDVL